MGSVDEIIRRFRPFDTIEQGEVARELRTTPKKRGAMKPPFDDVAFMSQMLEFITHRGTIGLWRAGIA